MSKRENKKSKSNPSGKITRKKAIKKIGITALTATSIIFLETKPGAAASRLSPAKAPKRGR